MDIWGTIDHENLGYLSDKAYIYLGHRLLGTKLSSKLLVPSCRFHICHIAGLQITNHGKRDIQKSSMEIPEMYEDLQIYPDTSN